MALVVFFLFVFIAKYVGKLAYRLMMKKDMQKSIRHVTIKVVKAVVIAIGFFIALGILDLDKVLTSVLAGAGVAGLALQGTLNNTFSGLLLSFLPEMKIHD
jgi:small conductance mechanosensitive channel